MIGLPSEHFSRYPKRLETIYPNPPLYFITTCTYKKKPLLARKDVHQVFRHYAFKNIEQGRVIGRYVIMPDHIHVFIRLKTEDKLSLFIQLLQQSISGVFKKAGEPMPYWQTGFFDHVLRSSESYAGKWQYVWNNPVRAGLVKKADDWPYQGGIAVIDRV